MLEWKEYAPHQFCNYNHAIAETPFGDFLITWKGWKERPMFTVDETPWGDWIGPYSRLEIAKEECEYEFSKRVMDSLSLLARNT